MRRCPSITSVIAAVCATACSATPRPTHSATFTDRSIRIESYAKSFRSAEPTLLQGLSFETRLFARTVPKPTNAQVTSSSSLSLGGGAWLSRPFADPFMFTDREAALGRARTDFEQVALPSADVAFQAEMLDPLAKPSDDPLLRQLRLDQAAFRRTFDTEDARLERERTLPRGAADLMRAIVLEWPLSPRPGAMHDLDSMLAWRFANVTEALAPNSLSEAERDDLRDVLAELAPRVASLTKAAAAMAKMRTTLDAMWVTPYATEDEATMDKELTVYVGSPISFDALDGALEASARSFEAQVDAGLSVLGAPARARITTRAKEILLAPPPCLPRVPVQTPLDMAPPDERAWSCALLHAFDDAKTDEAEIAADLAFHDAIVIARWAVSTHGPVRAPDAATRRAQLRLPLSPAEATRLMRVARARPWRAIAAGLTGHILSLDGAAHARRRAHQWRGIGDAPLDLVASLLAPARPPAL